jgi:hypothetical protein
MGARIRQVVIAASDLDAVADRLRGAIGLGAPFADPAIGHFGLRNAVFALEDTFLEVVSPAREGTTAGRLLERRGGDCGYMVMFQVDDLQAARRRAARAGVREVFEVSLPDMEEVHLHPADIGGAIVSLSSPLPVASWRWGGPEWEQRAAPLVVAGATIGVPQPDLVQARWSEILGELPGVSFVADPAGAGLVEITAVSAQARPAVSVGNVRFSFVATEEEHV